MAIYGDIAGDYRGSITPDDLSALGLISLANSSIQDDAVDKALANVMSIEQAKRSNLEKYLLAEEEAAKAEAEQKVNYASKRLSEITNALTMFGTVSGLTKSQKSEMEALKKERDQILKAFPMLGFAQENSKAGSDVNAGASSIADLIANNDMDEWKAFAKAATLEDFARLYDENLGQVPDALESMISYRIRNSKELTDKLKTDPSLRAIAHLSSGTLADSQKAEADKAKAAAKAKADADRKKDIDAKKIKVGTFIKTNNSFARERMVNDGIKKIFEDLVNGNYLSADEISAFKAKLAEQ